VGQPAPEGRGAPAGAVVAVAVAQDGSAGEVVLVAAPMERVVAAAPASRHWVPCSVRQRQVFPRPWRSRPTQPRRAARAPAPSGAGNTQQTKPAFCQTVTNTVAGTVKVTQQRCVTDMITVIVKFTRHALVQATLSRAGVVYATGTLTATHGVHRITLNDRRTVRPGSYRLTLSYRTAHGKRTVRSTIAIGP